MFLLKRSLPYLFILLILSCNKEEGTKTTTVNPDEKIEPENTGPTIHDQVFTLSENHTTGTSQELDFETIISDAELENNATEH
ncbi:hypothetical protein GH721_03125 [Kriegella sp. EG-1]|nr:hypothetical protein [Flavobacteriaceae bacterium EG-1]